MSCNLACWSKFIVWVPFYEAAGLQPQVKSVHHGMKTN